MEIEKMESKEHSIPYLCSDKIEQPKSVPGDDMAK